MFMPALLSLCDNPQPPVVHCEPNRTEPFTHYVLRFSMLYISEGFFFCFVFLFMYTGASTLWHCLPLKT